MRFWKKLMEQPWANMAMSLCIAILFFALLMNLNLFMDAFRIVYYWIRPIFLGIVIAYVLDPLANLFENLVFRWIARPGIRRSAATALTILSVILVVALLMVLLIPQLVDSIGTFVSNIGSYGHSLQGMLRDLERQMARGPIDLSDPIGRIEDIIGTVTSLLSNNMGSIGGVAAGIGSGVADAVLAFIVSIYFLVDKESVLRVTRKVLHLILDDAKYAKLSGYWKHCNQIFIQFMALDLLDGLLIGVINSIFMLIAGIPYSVLISVVVGVTNLFPTFGPVAGAVIGGLILVLVNPWYALWFLVFTAVLQAIDGYVLKPKLFGGSLNVPSILILITLIIGGRMFGVVGILLAIPFAAILMFIGQELFPSLFDKRTPPASAPRPRRGN